MVQLTGASGTESDDNESSLDFDLSMGIVSFLVV